MAPGSSFLGPASPQCTCRRPAGCHVVLVVRNARHSTEAKGTRLTPKEPDRPAAIMPFNACPSSAATGAPRAVKRSRPVGYVAQPDAQRAVPYRQHALLRNDQAEPDEPVPHWARCPQARCPRARCPQPRCPQRSTDRTGADNGLARFPRSHRHHRAPPSIFRDRCGIRSAEGDCPSKTMASHQPGVSWLWSRPFGGGDRSPRRGTRRHAPSSRALGPSKVRLPRLIGRRRHDRYDS